MFGSGQMGGFDFGQAQRNVLPTQVMQQPQSGGGGGFLGGLANLAGSLAPIASLIPGVQVAAPFMAAAGSAGKVLQGGLQNAPQAIRDAQQAFSGSPGDQGTVGTESDVGELQPPVYYEPEVAPPRTQPNTTDPRFRSPDDLMKEINELFQINPAAALLMLLQRGNDSFGFSHGINQKNPNEEVRYLLHDLPQTGYPY